MRLVMTSWRVAVAAVVLGAFLAGAAHARAAPPPVAPPVALPFAPAVSDTATPPASPANLTFSQFSGAIVGVGLKALPGPDGKLVPAKAANFDSIRFQPDGGYPAFDMLVVNQADKQALRLGANKRIIPPKPGRADLVWIDVDDPVTATKVMKITGIARPVDPWMVGWTVCGVTAALLLVAFLASGGKPLRFITGHDGRLSNSQFQLALWFGVVAIAYGSMLVLRVLLLGAEFISGIGLTVNVLALTGLSAVTFGGAKLVATQKQNAASDTANADAQTAAVTAKTAADAANSSTAAVANLDAGDPAVAGATLSATTAVQVATVAATSAALLANKAANTPAAKDMPAATAGTVKARLLDLFKNGEGETDLGDFQMILISVVAAGIFAVSSIHVMLLLDIARDILLPDVDSALLAIFGLGQGAYLVKKAVLPAGKG